MSEKEARPRGRAKFYEHAPIKLQIMGRPSPRQEAWMVWLALHGNLTAPILLATEREEPARDENGKLPGAYEVWLRASRHQLYLLWCKREKIGEKEGFVYRPIQQRATDNANYHPLVYALTEKGIRYLKRKGLWMDPIRPNSTMSADKWPHNLMISCITASIHIMCDRLGYRYIPPHEYLRGRRLQIPDLRFTWFDEEIVRKNGKVENVLRPRNVVKNLTPDSVFAIDYGDNSWIAYALEADRATERQDPPLDFDCKSAKRSFLQYQAFIKPKLYLQTYDRHCPLTMLYVTVSPAAEEKALELINKYVGTPSYIAVSHVPEFNAKLYNDFKPPNLLSHLMLEPCKRAGDRSPFTLKSPA